jgi:penicillin amidase
MPPDPRLRRGRRACVAAAALSIAITAAGCGDDDVAVPLAGDELPRADVEILVDSDGIPHVYGKDDRDAFFGAGYAMARDRLFQMDMARRRAHGRWAEVLGAERVADDELARLFDWRGLGRALADSTARDNAEEWQLVTAWVAGVNARIDEVLAGGAPLPYGFRETELDYLPERWQESDPLVVAKMTGFGNDMSLEHEIFLTIATRLKPEAFSALSIFRPAREVFTIPPEDRPAPMALRAAPVVGPRAVAVEPYARAAAPVAKGARALEALQRLAALRVMGSNNWAVDGRHTATGKSLLAGDPHLGMDFPGVFYALHINSKDAGGSFDVAGFAFPGTPGVSLGHTDKVAWAATTAFADVMDVFDVPLSADGIAVDLAGVPMPVVRRKEEIVVRGGAVETFEFSDVPGVGVLLPADIAPLPVASAGRELLLRWTGFDVTRPARLIGLDRATTIDEFDAAVDLQTGMNFNLVAADADGITFRMGLEVPIRDVAGGIEPWMVLDGADAAAAWTGQTLPRELLPRGRAAERGWIATANNDPYGFTANGRLDDDPWYFGALFDPGWRAGRAAERLAELAARGAMTTDDMEALQNDVHDNLADDLLPILSDAWAQVGSDPALARFQERADLATLVQLLTVEWDREMSRASAGALVFHAFSHLCAAEALEDDLTLLFYPAFDLEAVFLLKIASMALRDAYPGAAAIVQQGPRAAVLGALDRTATLLIDRFGSVDPASYRFEDMKVTSLRDGLGTGLEFGETPSDGGEATVNVSPGTFFEGEEIAARWVSRYGPIFRMVQGFSEDGTPELRYNFPLGNVAEPDSPHFNDQTESWRDGEYRTMAFRRGDVEARLESTIVLAPRHADRR